MKFIYLVLVGPLLVLRWIYRTTKRLIGLIFLATHDEVECPACGLPVSMVGRWQCGTCRYVFDGYVFGSCEICGTRPPYIECPACGVGIKDPLRTP